MKDLVAERKEAFNNYKHDITLMKVKTQEINDRYEAMTVELLERSVVVGEETITLADAARGYLVEQQDLSKLTSAKLIREAGTSSIEVTLTNGIVLDGDELSQNRLARALLVMSADDAISWIATNNKIVQLAKEDVAEAIKLSLENQSSIFLKAAVQNED